MESGNDITCDRNSVHLGARGIIARARHARMHVGAPKLLCRYVFTGSSFHDWRATEKYSSRILDHNTEFAKRRDVGRSRCAMTHCDRDLRYSHLGENGLVTEDPTCEVAI